MYHLYVIRTEKRAALQAYLKENGVETAVHYPTPLHLQPVFHNLRYRMGAFPHAERASNRVLSLPMHPFLNDGDISLISHSLVHAIQ